MFYESESELEAKTPQTFVEALCKEICQRFARARNLVGCNKEV